MPRVPVQFATESYSDRLRPLSSQQLVNLYLDVKPETALSRVSISSTPGLSLFTTAGDGPCRGMIVFKDSLYVVSGSTLFRVSSGGAVASVGNIVGSKPVSMAHDGTYIYIVSDFYMYYANESTYGILPETSCTSVTVLDGYAVFSKFNTQKFIINDVFNDPLTFNATEFDLANRVPDNIVGLIRVGPEIFVFGSESTERYYNSGNLDFPFSNTPSGTIERGCASARSIVSYQGLVAWLGDDHRVYTVNGNAAIPISTQAIDYLIDTLTGHESAIGFAYEQDGHVFYVLTFPGSGTIAYDVNTGKWHERKSYDRDDWVARCHARFGDNEVVGSAENGNLYYMDLDVYSENGNIIRRVMTAPAIHANNSRVLMSRFELVGGMGVGLATGQGSDPQVMLDWSDDNGYTYGTEHWRSMGQNAEYTRRAVWNRLGVFRARTLRLSFSDPVRCSWFEAFADLQGAAG